MDNQLTNSWRNHLLNPQKNMNELKDKILHKNLEKSLEEPLFKFTVGFFRKNPSRNFKRNPERNWKKYQLLTKLFYEFVIKFVLERTPIWETLNIFIIQNWSYLVHSKMIIYLNASISYASGISSFSIPRLIMSTSSCIA